MRQNVTTEESAASLKRLHAGSSAKDEHRVTVPYSDSDKKPAVGTSAELCYAWRSRGRLVADTA